MTWANERGEKRLQSVHQNLCDTLIGVKHFTASNVYGRKIILCLLAPPCGAPNSFSITHIFSACNENNVSVYCVCSIHTRNLKKHQCEFVFFFCASCIKRYNVSKTFCRPGHYQRDRNHTSSSYAFKETRK